MQPLLIGMFAEISISDALIEVQEINVEKDVMAATVVQVSNALPWGAYSDSRLWVRVVEHT